MTDTTTHPDRPSASVDLPPELLAEVDALAEASGCTRAELTREALQHFMERERAIGELLEARLEEVERGERIPHDEVCAEFEARSQERTRSRRG